MKDECGDRYDLHTWNENGDKRYRVAILRCARSFEHKGAHWSVWDTGPPLSVRVTWEKTK